MEKSTTTKYETLNAVLSAALGEGVFRLIHQRHEYTIEVPASQYYETLNILRDDARIHCEELLDLSGVDYSAHESERHCPLRYAVVVHLLSLTHNWRIRVRTFAENDASPNVDSIVALWSSANWYEREAFDLFGITFDGHPDLRRILTDYEFDGHPFRKDFPVSGYVEMHYDEAEQRVKYAPVTVAPRQLTPRVKRDAHYGSQNGGN